jgi:hypothetical protein
MVVRVSSQEAYIAHPPMRAAKITPLRMLNHLGASAVMSVCAISVCSCQVRTFTRTVSERDAVGTDVGRDL